MTTAPATDQDSTLYGPDGRPLTRPASQPAAPAPRPSTESGDWRAVTTRGTTTVWEKPRPDTPADAGAAERDAFRQAGIDHYQGRIDHLEAQIKAIESTTRNRPTPTPAPAPAKNEAANKPTPTTTTAAAAGPEKAWFDRQGPKIALLACVIVCATGEYALGRLAGFPWPVAAFLPVAMDVYVVQAMRRHRDVAVALILAVIANALDRLADARLFGVDRNGDATWWLIVAVVAIAPLIVWRVHRITETKRTGPTQETTGPATADRTNNRPTPAADHPPADRAAPTTPVQPDRGPEPTADRTARAPGGPDRTDHPDRTADRQPASGPDRAKRPPADRTTPDRTKRSAQATDRSTTGPDRTADRPLVLNDIEQQAVDRLRSTDRSISKRSIADMVRGELGQSIGSDRAAEIARHYRTLRSA